MTRFVREFRLIPVVLLATILLLGLKILGIVLNGGYTLADLDFSSPPTDDPVLMAKPGGRLDAAAPSAPKSWAQEMFNFPEVTGSIDANKPGSDKPTERSEAKTVETKTAEAKPAEPKSAEGAAAPPKPAAPPKVVDPRGGGTLVPLDNNGISSPGERAVLERLGERRQELDARSRELEIRENLLKSAEQRLDGRVNELKGMESQVGSSAQKKEAEDAARLKGLVTMYENMKAKDAAKIFDRLDMTVLIAVVSAMKPRVMSDIMAQMQPENAERLTVELAGRASSPASAAPSDLPKIEGRTAAPPPPQ